MTLFTAKTNKDNGDTGSIVFDMDGAIQKISYHSNDIVDQKSPPRFGDKVRSTFD